MKRPSDRVFKTYCWIVMLPVIIAMVLVLLSEFGVFEAHAALEVQIDAYGTKRPENGQIRDSGMPCEAPEQFAEWLETYEEEVEPEVTLYRIAGQDIDAALQVALFHHLQDAGIEWWYEIALCQMFQESHCQRWAVNPNGLDCGLYQYRSTYWNWSDGDIFDTDAQMRKYAADMAARFNAGLSTNEAISRHNTSDYVAAVNWEYVGQVKQWLSQMEVVR